jgi:extracellular elastinolytic metalloproteinase
MIQNAYNSKLDTTSDLLPDRQAFTGSSGGSFIQTVIRLTGFAGLTSRIRFRFTSDVAGGDDGWYIDDVLLRNESGITGTVAAFSGTTEIARSNAFAPFANPSAPLPVNFLLFEAKKQDKAAALHWTVNGELNINKYIVERSANGQAFSPIGEVPSSPSGGGDKDYYFTDNQPLSGFNYYRIEEKDLDGKSTFSVVKLIDFSNTGTDIILSPVPTYNHMVQLETGTGDDQPVAAYLVNTVGQTLKVFSLKPGVNQLTLDHFPQGVYMLKIITSQQKTQVRKLVIQ